MNYVIWIFGLIIIGILSAELVKDTVPSMILSGAGGGLFTALLIYWKVI